jgi:lipoate-protein ligase A
MMIQFPLRAPPKLLKLFQNHSHSRLRPLSTTTTTSIQSAIPHRLHLSYLDLRGLGLSILERLILEEFLLKHDTRRWILVGTHSAFPHRFLQNSEVDIPNEIAIVMGIGGKPKELLHLAHVQEDQVPVLKRFTGGGTVVMDMDAIWTTLIGRPVRHDVEEQFPLYPAHFPRPIMEYTANTFYQPLFQRLACVQESKRISKPTMTTGRKTLVLNTKSCAMENTGLLYTLPTTVAATTNNENNISVTDPMPLLQLRENDYVMGDYKIAGNAQSITKEGWLHHTSFLWNFDPNNMERYLTLPTKRPTYRKDRSHTQFLTSLQSIYPLLNKTDFFHSLFETCSAAGFVVERPTWPDVRRGLDAHGGLAIWGSTHSRTKLLDRAFLFQREEKRKGNSSDPL